MSRRLYDPSAPPPAPIRDPYRGVVFVLLALALLGLGGALAGYQILADPLLLDAAVTLGIASGILLGVALAQAARARPPKSRETASTAVPTEPSQAPAQATADQKTSAAAQSPPQSDGPPEDAVGMARIGTATAGAVAIVFALLFGTDAMAPNPLVAGIVAALCLAAAGLCFTAAQYLARVDPSRFPEAPGLCRGARVTAWILVLPATCLVEWPSTSRRSTSHSRFVTPYWLPGEDSIMFPGTPTPNHFVI